MATLGDEVPGVTDDPILRLILAGKAKTLDEAEEMYLDESLPEVLELLRRPISDDEAVRRQYRLFAQAVDRADKESARATLSR